MKEEVRAGCLKLSPRNKRPFHAHATASLQGVRVRETQPCRQPPTWISAGPILSLVPVLYLSFKSGEQQR
jgi:hypothetical protein